MILTLFELAIVLLVQIFLHICEAALSMRLAILILTFVDIP